MTISQQDTNQEMVQQMERLRASDADLQQEATVASSHGDNKAEIHNEPASANSIAVEHPYRFIPLRMGGNGGTHVPSQGSRYFIEHEVTLDDLKKVTNKFYELAFQDATLDKFIRSHNDPHGSRFAKWIHQKLSGSHVWDEDRASRGRNCPVHDRSSAHVAAWYSPKRSPEDRGQHFQLDDCRVWMRLHFYALRLSGLMEKSPSFADYYVRFIAHFVRVYERTAPPFAREALRWSEDPQNVEEYIANGRRMTDVLGLSLMQAAQQITDEELDDDEWPYNQTPR